MADEKALEGEARKPASLVGDAPTSAMELKGESDTVRAEAHKVGTEAVEQALSVPA